MGHHAQNISADGHLEHFALGEKACKGAVRCLTAKMHLLADVLEAGVAHERAGKQAGLGEDLKAVADAEDKATGVGELFHGLHDGSEAGDCAGPEVVAIGVLG